MEQDIISISWKDLPWQKFQKKSFRLQCKIYNAKQNNKPRLVRRLQTLLIKSKSIHYLAVRRISEDFINLLNPFPNSRTLEHFLTSLF
jgi:hypothetical protein